MVQRGSDAGVVELARLLDDSPLEETNDRQPTMVLRTF